MTIINYFFYCRFFFFFASSMFSPISQRFCCFPFRLFPDRFSFLFFFQFERERERISFPSYSRSESNERRHHFDFEVQPVSLSKTFRGKLLNAIGIFLGGLFVVLVVLLSFVPTDCPQSSKLVAQTWVAFSFSSLYTSCYKERRIKKGTRTLRTIQKQERKEENGADRQNFSPLSPQSWFYPFLSIHLSFSHTHRELTFQLPISRMTGLVLCRDMYLCIPPSLLPLFVGIMPVSPAAQTRPNVLVFLTPISQIYTYILLLYSHTFPCHPSFSLLAPTFSFDTGARATTLDGSICPSVSVPHLSRNPRSFAFLSRCLLSFLSFHTIPFVRLYHIGRTWRICGKEGNNYHYE